MISHDQVYDASGDPIPCQVNPVMTSEGIASSKYEVNPLMRCVVFNSHCLLHSQLVFIAKMAPLSLTKYHIAGVANKLTTMADVMCSGDPPSR